RVGDQPGGHLEGALGGVQEQLADQVDHGDAGAVGGFDDRHAPARGVGGVVGGSHDPVVRFQERVDLTLPVGVVPQRDRVHAGRVQLEGDAAGDADAVGRVLGVRHHQVDAVPGA